METAGGKKRSESYFDELNCPGTGLNKPIKSTRNSWVVLRILPKIGVQFSSKTALFAAKNRRKPFPENDLGHHKATSSRVVKLSLQAPRPNSRFHPISQTLDGRFGDWLRWAARGSYQCALDLRQAAIHWVQDEGSGLAASVSYYLALSLFPMMLLLSSGVGLFLKFSQLGQDAQGQILDLLAEHTSPVVRTQIEEVLLQMKDHALLSGPAGLFAATLAAIGVFSQFDRALTRIWGIKPIPSKGWRDSMQRFMTHRVSAFFMLIGLGILLVLVFISNLCLTAVHTLAVDYLPRGERFLAFGEMMVTIALNGFIFAVLYRVIAKKSMRWDDAYKGGLIVALVWEAGRNLLGLTLIGMRYTTAYGVIGSFIALLAWCYYGVSIILYGAEYIQVLQQRRKTSGQIDNNNATKLSIYIPPSEQQPHFTTTQTSQQHPRSAFSEYHEQAPMQETIRIRPRRVA